MNPPGRDGARPRAERLISSARSHPGTPRARPELDEPPTPRTTARPSLARSTAAATDYRASIPSSQRRRCRPSRVRGAFAAWGHRRARRQGRRRHHAPTEPRRAAPRRRPPWIPATPPLAAPPTRSPVAVPPTQIRRRALMELHRRRGCEWCP
jgi:hypothetical protein